MSADMSTSSFNRIKNIILELAEIQTEPNQLSANDNLFDLGMSSRASVNVMIALESEFDIEFPDEMLRKEVFESITAICTAIETLQEKV